MLSLTRFAPAAPSNIVDLLLDCHERIRGSLVLIRRLAETADVPRDQVTEAADRLRRYYRIALPLHALDEEESVLPRLRGLEAQLDEQLDMMCDEHDEHQPAVAALLEICDELARDPAGHESRRKALGILWKELQSHFAAHLEREEWVIFPAIQTRLDASTRAAMVRELRARRAVG